MAVLHGLEPTPAPTEPTPVQFTGRDDAGEFLVTIYPAVGDKPACAAVTWRADQWESWSPEVPLSEVAS